VRELALLRWGLVPTWARDPQHGYKMINARAETIASKPSYREAIQRRQVSSRVNVVKYDDPAYAEASISV